MSAGVLFPLTLVGLMGAALMAGLFFAFSVSVMPALARRPPTEGMAAMQAINLVIVNPVFLVAFVGTGLAAAALVVLAVVGWSAPAAPWLLAGGLAAFVGTIAVTAAANVPMNNALAAAEPAGAEGAALWARYLTRWTAWNHARTVLNLAATGLLAVGLCQL